MFRVQGSLRFRAQGCERTNTQTVSSTRLRRLRVQGSRFRAQGSGFRVKGSGFRIQDSGLRAQGSGFMVQGSGHEHETRMFCTGAEARRAWR
jgi:hypothetical protein